MTAFLFQGNGIQHHAIADQVGLGFVKDTAGYLVQYYLFPIHIERVRPFGPPWKQAITS